ncbi:MAG: NADH:flavin oxidoreductase [Thermoleophilia bacterium]|nr:NADH:flavin oxidoreductase [Thermoleophilia bacterium]
MRVLHRLLAPGVIGSLAVPNRIVRSATCEGMAGAGGEVTQELTDFHRRLAAGGVGLALIGHAYVHPRGQATPNQTGIHNDGLISGLSHLVDEVRAEGGRLFAQLAHAGSQTKMQRFTPLAPSAVPNALTGRMPDEATEGEIEEAVDAFGQAARRAREAGFDGVEIHGANGYLISEFCSPCANVRNDRWGGDAERRSAFVKAVYAAVRQAVGDGFPVALKLGMVDMVAHGVRQEESAERAASLAALGLDAVEVSCGVMVSGADSCHTYVAVDGRRAFSDLLFHRVFSAPSEEAYFAGWVGAVRERAPGLTVLLVGGMRSPLAMERLLEQGVCDFVCLGRPLVREPDLAAQIEQGRVSTADCTSCNICLAHDGYGSLRCWRKPRTGLARHAALRATARLH